MNKLFSLTIFLRTMVVALSVMGLMGCSSTPPQKSGTAKPERNVNAPTLTVNAESRVRQVLEAAPPESLMEHFDAYDTQGRLISYIAFTDTEAGALLFVDDRLQGVLTREDAQIYYACRGHVMMAERHYWASDLQAWLEGLLLRVHPEASVQLEFSGKSTVQSIKEATENPVLGRIRSILGMGTNPLSIFSTLNTARNDYDASEQFKNEIAAMNQLKPGMRESRLAEISSPHDLGFLGQGMVMAYPTHRVEYFIMDGQIRVIQQPSLYTLSRLKPGAFYLPGVRWSRCNPKEWMEAVTQEKPAEAESQAAGIPAASAPAVAK